MKQSVKDYVIEKVNELINAPTCCAEAKKAAQNWLDALGTDREAEQTKSLIAELEQDIVTVDGLIAFPLRRREHKYSAQKRQKR